MASARAAGVELKRLRRRFVLTNMLFVTIVLVAVCALIIGFNVKQRVDDVYLALNRSLDATTALQDAPGQIGIGEKPQLSPKQAPRESGEDLFVATSVYVVDPTGTYTATVSNPWSLDSETLTSALGTAYTTCKDASDGAAQGFISDLNLYYAAATTDNGCITVTLASGNYVDQAAESSLMIILAAACAFVAFLIMSLLISRRVVRPIERVWEQQQRFIADASHELKTPLTVILANNSLIMTNPEASVGSQMQWIESTEAEAKSMQGLVNDLLYLARSDVQQSDKLIGDDRVDFSDVVEGSALTFDSVAFERGVTLVDDVEQGLFVRGDTSNLQRMAATLVDNACKYANQGGTVRVSLRREGDTCRFVVNNTGPAISPEDLPHLFDRFYRADKARTRGNGGFGLGLSIAQSIVEAHKGTIEAASTEEEGTTFTVTLPIDGA